MEKKSWVLIFVGVLVLGIVGYYLAGPLFTDEEVNEELPENVESSYEGIFVDADSFHKTSGRARVVEQDGKTYLRLEDFSATNGPDLKVYLAKDLEANEYISLGELKGNVGNQNYEISEEVNFEEYNNVLIWCEAFSVLFGSADLES